MATLLVPNDADDDRVTRLLDTLQDAGYVVGHEDGFDSTEATAYRVEVGDEILPIGEAVEKLAENSGQTYALADVGFNLAAAFGPEVSDEFILEHTAFDGVPSDDEERAAVGRLALSERFAEVQRASTNARGLTNVAPHQMLVTYSDVSEILVTAMGGEPATSGAAGAGFRADGEHRGNVERIKSLLDEVEA